MIVAALILTAWLGAAAIELLLSMREAKESGALDGIEFVPPVYVALVALTVVSGFAVMGPIHLAMRVTRR